MRWLSSYPGSSPAEKRGESLEELVTCTRDGFMRGFDGFSAGEEPGYEAIDGKNGRVHVL